ncbi:hypothetical protein [Paraburkholderia sp. BCC1885]|uniref:AbiU2 domain-containing protein n=1 Tax=Paraburkholderia sp. BCC1885 TaxID=2562669 RepID=UPI001181DE29|nr:hypothetical protein [Paraburkholderia sp. BCC1885]
MDYGTRIADLERQIDIALEEITLVIGLHESWKPMAYDEALIDRMGTSFATGTFSVIRRALRREMLMALMRIWDDDKRAISIRRIVSALREPGLFDALVRLRAEATTGGFQIILAEHIESNFRERIERVGQLCDKYESNGIASDVMKRLVIFRNTSLAHRQKEARTAAHRSAKDEAVEAFYLDTRTIVEDLMHVVRSTAIDMKDTAQVYGLYARFFWEAVRGERTLGHPSYREPVTPSV